MADESFDIRRVVVVGAGTMGHGIAQVAAQAGFEVVLNDVSAAAVAKGLAQLRANLDGGVAKGKLTVEARDAALQRVQGEPDLRSAAALRRSG